MCLAYTCMRDCWHVRAGGELVRASCARAGAAASRAQRAKRAKVCPSAGEEQASLLMLRVKDSMGLPPACHVTWFV
jgi:hypothetical protein